MNRRVKIGIMVALLVLTVGFAAVTTTLIINGTLTIASDQAGFDKDVIFTKAKTNGKAFITENGKTIEFSADLQDIGEEDDLRYEITNKNRQYDASGTIECDFVDPDNRLNEYITITPSPESFEIEASRKKTGHVVVRMVKSFIGDEDVVGDNDPANIGEIGFKCTIKLEAGERNNLAPEVVPVYTDATLNGADPTVGGDLVPVMIADDGTVTYADEYEEWYNYREKKWANAVILEEGSNSRYDTGDIIKEEDIKAFFVWIPRYKYQLWNVSDTRLIVEEAPESSAHPINIVFETKDVEPSTGTQNGEWLTHPAFTTMDANGLWVTKYEIGYKGANKEAEARVSSTDASKLISKPNTYSWRGNSTSNMFQMIYNYERTMDSHMIKNTEWGAVSYLSHSQYGINTEININNNGDYKTGYSSVEGDTKKTDNGSNATVTQLYNTEVGYKASTTGNITGIYDMSGGSFEYVAAYIEGAHDANGLEKYYDIYPENTENTSYGNRILGDATGEMGPFRKYKDTFTGNDPNTWIRHNSWYADYSTFIQKSHTWFVRGGLFSDGSVGGAFAFTYYNGEGYGHITTRAVLVG
ncbi:MAG: hypothetical protein OSJ70_03625 [Bacilli bacterium]|nr:hypothetical protein [Bacilli bacterium]